MNASRIVKVNVIRSVPAPVLLQQAQPQPQEKQPFFKTKNGKIAIGVAALAASIGVGYALTRGPDPRPWP